MTDMQQFWLAVIGGFVAIIIGILGLTNPPVLTTGSELSYGLIAIGLLAFGVGPIRTAYGVARSK